MRKDIIDFIACPLCRSQLIFEGDESNERFVNGHFKCSRGHLFQVKEEIGLLKDAKVSAGEFEWKVNVADEKRYDEIQRQYNSYLRDDQKDALKKLMDKLVSCTIASCEESGNTVLDVATGMGRFILPLAEKSARGVSIIGTDIDEKPLRGAMSKAKRANTYQKISLVVTDAKHLAFKSNVLSTVTSNFGFDNVPEATLAFMEAARVLQPNGKVIFSSLWFKEGSESMKLAETHGFGQMASEARLKRTLDKAGLVLDWIEKVYSGVWPHNPMDLLPLEGEEYSHVVVQAHKPKG
ncbi:MAG: class I SAM-dependent methyltransferase [Candidatus Bathyarchaeia archaeon]